VLALAGCAVQQRGLSPAEGRARVAALMPGHVPDKDGWATDIYTALAVLDVEPTPDNICAVLSVTEQETGYKVDPVVPNLAAIAWKEIERQRAEMGIPKLLLDAALDLQSGNGRTYRQRLDAARTERELSDIFEDMIGRVPLGKRFFGDRNPVRTGGPMQVAIEFAAQHARRRPYPYPVLESIRDEVFTRRGGMYFGIAHLFDYPVAYDRYLYRYADFNAGQYASRNAAFQQALATLTGKPLALDGDLVLPGAAAVGATEAAARSLAAQLGMVPEQVRRDLELEKRAEFSSSELYGRLFALADRRAGKPVPRAVVPSIELKSAKFTRKLTTAWFAQRVVERHRACLKRVSARVSPGEG